MPDDGSRRATLKVALVPAAAAAMSMVIGITAAIMTGTRIYEGGTDAGDGARNNAVRNLDHTVDIALLKGDLAKLQQAVSKLGAPSPDQKSAAAIADVASTVNDVQGRLHKLEDAIIQTPARAIEVPLLRRDLETVASDAKASAASLHDEIGRIYDLLKWFLGLMITTMVGLLGLAVTNLLKPAKA